MGWIDMVKELNNSLDFSIIMSTENKHYKCPQCKSENTVIFDRCSICEEQHLHMECKDCGYHWNEWTITDKKAWCCGDPDRYPWTPLK